MEGFRSHDILVERAGGGFYEWRFRIRAPRHETLRGFQSYCWDNEIPIEIERISKTAPVDDPEPKDLTTLQRETLLLAFKRGYFEIPRRTTLDELSDEFDVTRQAVSDRLRRGIDTLIDRTLVDGEQNDRS